MDNLGLTLDYIPIYTILQAEIAKDMILIKNVIKSFFSPLLSIEFTLKIESEHFSLTFYKPIPQQNKKASTHLEFGFYL